MFYDTKSTSVAMLLSPSAPRAGLSYESRWAFVVFLRVRSADLFVLHPCFAIVFQIKTKVLLKNASFFGLSMFSLMSNIGREDSFYVLSCCIGVDSLEMTCLYVMFNSPRILRCHLHLEKAPTGVY